MKSKDRRGEQGELIVAKAINEDKDEHYLINNLILMGNDNVSHQFDHILIRHNGVFVIETKHYYGDIIGSKDDLYWSKTYLKHRKTVKDTFINPLKQNNAHIRFLRKVLGKDIPLFNFVVFVNNNVTNLGIYSVCNLNQVLIRISGCEGDKTLTSLEMQKINHTLLLLEADIQTEDHVKNIKAMVKRRKDSR